MSVLIPVLLAAVIAAAVFTVTRGGLRQALSAVTLTRLLPLGAATDVLMAHYQVGPHLLPPLTPALTGGLVSGLITLNLALHLTLRRP